MNKQLFVASWKACRANWYWGYLIAAWTGGPYCHSELLFEPPSTKALCFSATIEDGVRMTLRDVTGPDWAILPVGNTEAEYNTALARAQTMFGAKLGYDAIAFVNFLIPAGVHLKNERFCSEACADVLRSIGKLQREKLPSFRISPNQLYKDVTAESIARPAGAPAGDSGRESVAA